ncbi:peptidoglycan D,D-transpeptidase FtsI family protein [Marinivivus vitaminiproducens]|uniref:peptidoglycan D,D-transpeptidase FtsI family protein n=1 Tax=Marinivivus vitaminiproducens TaxID=3035935 RepID=UPI0027A58B16|nr:penicillin-binding protein 2 [Geminicoccaceae bacterium SCSIO 64248]
MSEADPDLARCRARLVLVAGAFLCAFLLIGVRLVVFASVTEAAADGERPVAASGRADIVDRNGVLLATNLRAPSIFAHPLRLDDPERVAGQLAEAIPGLRYDDLVAKLSRDTPFVWIKRHIAPVEEQAIINLGIPGVDLLEEERRVYPQGSLAGHVLGFVDDQNKGLAGVERQFEARLTDEPDDALRLSLDARVQEILHEEVAKAMRVYEASAGNAVVLDATSGEVVAMVSLPDFDPNFRNRSPERARFNRNSMGLYEVGSMFKLFTVAAALEEGEVNLRSTCDASEPLKIGRWTVRDFQGKQRMLTLAEAIMHSSNICASRMALALGPDRQRASLERFGMLDRVAIELPEVATPMLPSDSNWGQIRSATVSFGYGLSVTPLHVAQGVAALVNGGVRRPVTLLPRTAPFVPAEADRVVSHRTSNDIRWLMWATANEGSGRGSMVDGYFLGGKTGTANKRRTGGRGYDPHRRLSSFVATFPIDQPRYVVLAMLDEPKPAPDTYFATGGVVSAPLVGNIVRRLGPLLGEAPEPQNADAAFRKCLAKGEAVNGRTHRKEPSFASVCASI